MDEIRERARAYAETAQAGIEKVERVVAIGWDGEEAIHITTTAEELVFKDLPQAYKEQGKQAIFEELAREYFLKKGRK